MIVLHQFRPAFGMRTGSPFGLKLETYMRMAGIPYEVALVDNPRKGPKGKIPFIVDDGRAIGDSGHIVDHLVEKFGDKVDAHLAPAERAAGHAITRMVEESLYFTTLYTRWEDDVGFAVIQPVFFAMLPPVLRGLISKMARKAIKKQLQLQGIGRHSREEVFAHAKKDLRALSDLLGSKAFLLGDRPSSVDACVYGQICGILAIPIDNPVKAEAMARTNLKALCDRIEARFFAA